MSKTIRLLAAAAALVALAAVPQAAGAVDTGSADFTRYVAMGDSLTAGFCSGSIIVDCQRNSYPALIFHQATGRPINEFQQPTVSAPGLPGVLRLVSLAPLVIAPTPGQGVPTNLNLPRPYDNMAIPGANLHDVLFKTQSTSPSDPTDLVLRRQGFTQVQQALGLHPTFVTLWIGNNDALASATSGGVIPPTPVAQFDVEYHTLAGAIANSGAKLAVATIPDVTSIPFVTTLTRFVPNPATGQPLLINGNPVPLIGVNPGDFVLLTAQQAMAQGFGIPLQLGGNGQPLPGSVVLTAAEAANIRNFVNSYNNSIRSAATAVGAAVVDANAALSQIAVQGLNIGGVTYTSAFLTGGLFSYDGVHPSAFGYAFISNLFIDAINDKFGGSIPETDLYPFMFNTGVPVPTGGGIVPDGAFYFSPLAWDNLRGTLGWTTTTATPAKPRRHHHH